MIKSTRRYLWRAIFIPVLLVAGVVMYWLWQQGKAPYSEYLDKGLPLSTPPGTYQSPFFSRPSGMGRITETNYSPFNSRYKIWNSWQGSIKGLDYMAFAGGRQPETESETPAFDGRFWKGVLIVRVADEKGNLIHENSGEFLMPENLGPVKIVDSAEAVLTLVAREGGPIYFDLLSHKFFSEESETKFVRQLGEGELIENGIYPFSLNDFDVVNQFRPFDQDVQPLMFFAGRSNNDLKQGVFLSLLFSSVDASKVEGIIYTTHLKDGALRIVDGEDGKLVIVSESGLIYTYDLFAGIFTSVPEGDSIDSAPITLSTINDGGLSATNTPTPRPTRTALPTNIPYP